MVEHDGPVADDDPLVEAPRRRHEVVVLHALPGVPAGRVALRQPAVRQSICTGELTAGFIDRATGRFIELMRLDGRKEMEDFCQRVGVEIDEMKVIY